MSESDELKETDVSDSGNIDTLKEVEKEKLSAAEMAYDQKQNASAVEAAAEDEAAAQESGTGDRKMAWVPGVILIGLGVVFLLNNTTNFAIDNWWALFILIPAFGSFSKAADSMRSAGEFTRDAWGALAGGLILTLVASAFLFDLNWNLIWPVFLIIGGLGLLFGALRSW